MKSNLANVIQFVVTVLGAVVLFLSGHPVAGGWFVVFVFLSGRSYDEDN